MVAVHIPAGLIAVISGAGAMLAEKGSPTHRRRGLTYLVALAVVWLSGLGLVITRWPRFPHLLALALMAGGLASAGYAARHRPRPTLHLVCMGASYIAMLTAFYVDNGPKLPLWNRLPPVAFWLLPSLIGIPMIVRGVRRRVRPEAVRSHSSSAGWDDAPR